MYNSMHRWVTQNWVIILFGFITVSDTLNIKYCYPLLIESFLLEELVKLG